MSVTRRSTDGFALQVMVGLCLVWGVQQVMIKWAAADIAPVMQAAGRSGMSALLVGLLICWKGGWNQVSTTWRGGLLAGALFGLEFFFISEGLQLTTAAHMSVFLYTAPIFTALGVHWLLPSERLRPLQWLGIVLAFIGIAIAFAGGVSWDNLDYRMLMGDALGVLAGASWGATTVAVTSVLFQGVVVSFFSYLVWFWLLRRYLAANLAVFSFMTPLFGVTFGVVLLGEELSLNFILGAVLVLAGITFVSAEQWLRRRLRKALGQ